MSFHRDLPESITTTTTTSDRSVEIAQFCRGFLNGNYQHLHQIVAEYDGKFARIDIVFTSHNFDNTFQLICKYLFTARPATSSYVLAVLGFAVTIDNQLKNSSTWYSSDIMVGSLTSVLVDINFDPRCVEYTRSLCVLL